MLVNLDAVLDVKASGFGEVLVWADADANNGDVEIDLAVIGQTSAGELAVLAD